MPELYDTSIPNIFGLHDGVIVLGIVAFGIAVAVIGNLVPQRLMSERMAGIALLVILICLTIAVSYGIAQAIASGGSSMADPIPTPLLPIM